MFTAGEMAMLDYFSDKALIYASSATAGAWYSRHKLA